MSIKLIRRVFIPLAAITLICVALWLYVMPSVLNMQMTDILKQYGFKDAKIGQTKIYQDRVIFESIALDNNKFSNVESITARFQWTELFTKSTFDKITFKNITLSGEIKNKELKIAGYDRPDKKQSYLQEGLEIEITSLSIDLLTAIGGIKLEAKAYSRLTKEGHIDLTYALWGNQYQLQLDAKGTGEIKKDGKWNFNIDLNEARLNIDTLNMSRINGWIDIDNNNETRTPNAGGQFTAGTVKFKSIPFSRTELTFDISKEDFKMFLIGEAAGFKNLTAALELKNVKDQEQLWLSSSFAAFSLEEFLSFMTALHETLTNDEDIPSSYKQSMIDVLGVHQARKDIQQTLEQSNFKQIEFSASGPVDDLLGKITGQSSPQEKSGRYVISLDPNAASE